MSRSTIPYSMFELQRSADEARRASKLSTIYHKGQERIWDGRDVLGELLDKHGGIHANAEVRGAIGRIFSVIMWGELAAWRISAQLADRIEPLEAKMAATSQAHDEARHFYVLYDYLVALDYPPGEIDRASHALLDLVLREDDLGLKLMGMQLMIETIAITIFQNVRKSGCEPVLCELLPYYERDEARHIGLGIQYLPDLLKEGGRLKIPRMTVYNLRLIFRALMSLQVLEPDLATLGIPASEMNRLGIQKQQQVFDEMWDNFGRTHRPVEKQIVRLVDTVTEAWFPPDDARGSVRLRAQAAWRMWRHGGRQKVEAALGVAA
jgi:hypothetical protein